MEKKMEVEMENGLTYGLLGLGLMVNNYNVHFKGYC